MATSDRKFDMRTRDTFFRDGRLTREEWAEHLESLPDVSEKGAPMESEFVAGVLDDEAPEDVDES